MSDVDTTTAAEPITLRLARALEASEGRARLAEQLWSRTPAYIDEWAYNPSASQVICQPKTSQPFLVEAVVATVPASGNLTLGDRVLYLSAAGVFTFAPVQILLTAGDLRVLTASSSGAISLLLTGHQLPQWGTLR